MGNASNLAALSPGEKVKVGVTLRALDTKLSEAERKIRGRIPEPGSSNFTDRDTIADLRSAFTRVREMISRGTQGIPEEKGELPLNVHKVLSDVLSVIGHFRSERALETHHKEAIEAIRTALGLEELTENPELVALASRPGHTRPSRSRGAGRRP